jgi:hypothetical protein
MIVKRRHRRAPLSQDFPAKNEVMKPKKSFQGAAEKIS